MKDITITRSERTAGSLWSLLIAVVVVLAGVMPGRAIELPPSKVHDAMNRTMYADSYAQQMGSAAEFDDEWSGASKPPTALEVATETSGRKSMFKAAALSALVPGGGQYYVGNKRTAYYFFAAEALTWVGYASFKVYGNWREDDYIRYAAVNANANLDGKSDEYVDLVGFYDDIDQYNSLARAFDPDPTVLAGYAGKPLAVVVD